MPHSDDYDDYDDRTGRRDVPSPAGVRLAGIIWIAFGIVAMITYVISFAVSGVAGPAGRGANANPCSLGCGVLFAGAFLIIGVQTVRGTAKGTLGNGIGSLVFGLLYTGGAILLVVLGANGRLPAGQNVFLFVAAAIVAVFAISLLTAGILAIVGREGYADWLAAEGRQSRRRRRTIEEEDYDDERRPRRDPDEPA